MKCNNCGNTDVLYKGERKDGVAYQCPKCNNKFVFDNGRGEVAPVKTHVR